ncbi:HAMP domain-containing histidine kinase [Massilia sp. H-1]|nr:HAMP domain-containing histidine kinase [Massilia sp. H-1]
MDALIADMHALRASILTLWREQDEVPDLDEVLGLNHAIDQAETEAVARFSAMMQHAQHLFLAILGHDLRNPLNTTVMGASFLMRAPGIAQGHADVAARIHHSGIRMGRLVEDLLDYTRINLGSPLPLTLTKCNMGSICRSTMEELRLSNPERVFQLAHDGDLDGVWDEGRIAQVFSNLLGNAVQHGRAANRSTCASTPGATSL